jgi:streptogramin lyase
VDRAVRRLFLVAALLFSLAPSAGAATGSQTVFSYSGSGNAVAVAPGVDGNIWFTQTDFNATGNLIGVMTPTGVVTAQHPTGVFRDEMFGIAPGPDGNMWFTNLDKGTVNRMTLAGVVTPFHTLGGQPYGITAGPDGNVWITRHLGDAVDRVTPTGTDTPFSTSTEPYVGITPGADGNLWFTEDHPTEFIGRITPAGVLTEFPLGSGNRDPWGIAAGPDGNLWFCERNANKIARITPAGVITEFALPPSATTPSFIVAGSDGNLWSDALSTSTSGGSLLLRITTSGTITEFPVAHGVGSLAIASGPDGNLWFGSGSSIVRTSVAHSGVGYVLSLDAAFAPARRGVSQGGTAQWSFYGARAREVQDASGMGLFDSGPRHLVSFFTCTFTAAGSYAYRDPLDPTLTGSIGVPVVATPASGGTTTAFTITWATGAPAAGFVYDVQIKRPGSSSYVNWQSGVTAPGAMFTPDAGAGSYSLRARLRKISSGASSGWSAGKTISVS